MRYAASIVLIALLGFWSATPAAAQQKQDSAVDRLFNQVLGATDEKPDARGPSDILGRRDGDERAERGGRGRTDREGVEGRRTDRRGSDRGRTARTDTDRDDRGEARTDRTQRSDRKQRTDRTQRTDDRNAPWEVGRRTGDDDWENDRAERRGAHGKKGKGPKFCRSGEGHPVHGREWCRDKGFGLGDDRDVWDVRRDDRRYPSRTENRSILDDILGRRYDK